MMVARAQPRVVIFTQQEQLGALLVGQSHWQWGRSRHRQQPLKNKSDAIEYIIITTYTYMPYFCHIPLGRRQGMRGLDILQSGADFPNVVLHALGCGTHDGIEVRRAGVLLESRDL